MSIFGNKNLISFPIEKVLEVLPHRYPFLLVDKIIALNTEEKTIIAIKNVTINEPFFQGHFPSRPIMPGVLIVEAMAQAAGICALESDKSLQGNLFYFLSIENAKFRVPVVPGDVIRIEAKLVKGRGPLSKFNCNAYVENNLVTEAILTAKVIMDK